MERILHRAALFVNTGTRLGPTTSPRLGWSGLTPAPRGKPAQERSASPESAVDGPRVEVSARSGTSRSSSRQPQQAPQLGDRVLITDDLDGPVRQPPPQPQVHRPRIARDAPVSTR